jgi:hypothetical protein
VRAALATLRFRPSFLDLQIDGNVQKLVAEIMAAWRRAERLGSTLPEGSPEHAAAQRASERLRNAYQELTHSGVAEALTAADARILLRDAATDVEAG